MGNGRWSKSLRLRRSLEFRAVQKNGRRFVTKDLVVLWQRTDDDLPRFGLTVSRKVGNAVVRNRVKRWLREALRTRRGSLSGVDVVVIARHNARTAGYSRIEDQIIQAVTHIGRKR